MLNRNRERFIFELSKLVSLSSDPTQFYLCSVDFSEFKQINYHYGFCEGDFLLESFAEYAQSNMHCIFCNQLSADHFIVVMKVNSPLMNAEIIAKYSQWWEGFEAQYQDHFPLCKLHLWCGIYQLRDNDIASAIERAEMARRKAKEIRSPTAVFFEPSMLHEIEEENRNKTMVAEMLHENGFRFYLQPQVDIETGEIFSAEALARGFDQDGQIVSPDIFVPIMEKDGSITELDFLILEQVCRYLRRRLDAGKPVVRTSINLSRIHIKKQGTAEHLHYIINKYAIPSELILFELTETAVEFGFEETAAFIDQLHRYGYSVSLDDFGSGYAGIDTCHRIDFDELKLDKSLLGAAEETDKRGRAIIEGMILIMRKLNTEVICEGVETSKQCRKLLKLGCHYVQGFYFSKPVPPDEFYQTYEKLNGIYPIE